MCYTFENLFEQFKFLKRIIFISLFPIQMVVLAQLGGENTVVPVRFAVGSLTLTSGMGEMREEEEEREVKGQRRNEMVCQSGAQMKKTVKWEPLILLERSCVLR